MTRTTRGRRSSGTRRRLPYQISPHRRLLCYGVGRRAVLTSISNLSWDRCRYPSHRRSIRGANRSGNNLLYPPSLLSISAPACRTASCLHRMDTPRQTERNGSALPLPRPIDPPSPLRNHSRSTLRLRRLHLYRIRRGCTPLDCQREGERRRRSRSNSTLARIPLSSPCCRRYRTRS